MSRELDKLLRRHPAAIPGVFVPISQEETEELVQYDPGDDDVQDDDDFDDDVDDDDDFDDDDDDGFDDDDV